MNRMTRPSCLPSSLRTAFRRSSNSPRNLAPAISAPCPGPAGACPEAVRHFAVDDALGQALDDGGLADAGFADQHRVVLGPPLQDLDGPADLVVATDHRVELAFLGALGHVDGVLVQRLARLLDVRVVHRFAAAQVGHGILQRLARHALAEQQLAEPGVLVHRGQQYQLAGDELVALLLGQAVSLVEQACEILGQVHVAGRALDLRQRVEFFVEAAAQGGDIEADLHQQGLIEPPCCSSRAESRCTGSMAGWSWPTARTGRRRAPVAACWSNGLFAWVVLPSIERAGTMGVPDEEKPAEMTQ